MDNTEVPQDVKQMSEENVLVNISYKTDAYMTALVELSRKEIELLKAGKLFGGIEEDEHLIKKITDESEFDYIIPSSVDIEEIKATEIMGDWPFNFNETEIVDKT
jgi:hypothetical protein